MINQQINCYTAQIYLGGTAFNASQTSSGFHESCVTDKCLECCAVETNIG